MDRMKGEEQRRRERDPLVREKPLRKPEYQANHQAVQEQVHQVEAKWVVLEQFVGQDVAERHERAAVVGAALMTLKRPEGRGEDFPHVEQAVRVGIAFDLLMVGGYKAIHQRVGIKQEA